jgi:hypothetical protein
MPQILRAKAGRIAKTVSLGLHGANLATFLRLLHTAGRTADPSFASPVHAR